MLMVAVLMVAVVITPRAPSPEFWARDTPLDGAANGSAGVNSAPNVDAGINGAPPIWANSAVGITVIAATAPIVESLPSIIYTKTRRP